MLCFTYLLHGPIMLADRPEVLVNALYLIQLLEILRKHLAIGQYSFSSFFSAFHWPQSFGKPLMIPTYFVKTTESYELTLVTIYWQSLYGRYPPSRLRNHTRFADG